MCLSEYSGNRLEQRFRLIGMAIQIPTNSGKEKLKLAQAAGARTVDLTSRPSREAAGRLYERVGFEPRGTRLYRYTFEPR